MQTYKPEHPVILASADQDYRAFYQMEFKRRRTGLYPPFTVLCRLLVESAQGTTAQKSCQKLYDACQNYVKEHPQLQKRVLMMRMDVAPVKMIRGKIRYHVLLKLFEHPDTIPLAAFLSDLSQAESNPGCQVYFEWNPASLM